MTLSLSRFAPIAASFAAALALLACGGASSESGATAEGESKTAKAAEHGPKPTDMTIGAEDAPVTVIEYASVTCPHCATFHETIFPEIKEKYVDTGKVQFVFRDFPTPPVPFAYIGAVLSRCAAEKGGEDAYFLVLGSLFKNQRTWIYAEDPKVELLKIASQVGMNEAEFDECLKRQDLVDVINEGVEEGSEKYQIQSTPNFVVNGKRTPITSIEDFDKAYEEALAADAS